MTIYKCECSKEFDNKRGFYGHCMYCKTHIKIHNLPERLSNFRFRKGKPPWNKGLTKETDERIKNSAEKTKELYKSGQLQYSFKGKHHTKESKEKISKNMKNNKNAGGYRKGSGRGKKGWYDGIFFDSQWELAFWIYCIDHNIPIKRNTNKFYYTLNNEQHYYLPDFIINENEIIEIKGYKTKLVEIKTNLIKNIKVFYRDDLNYVFDYIKEKYNLKENEIYKLYNGRQLAG